MTYATATPFDHLDPRPAAPAAPDTAEAIRYGQALDIVTAERDRARRSAKELQASLGVAWERVDHLHKTLTAAEAARDRYRHQADLANTERARLAEELAELLATLGQVATAVVLNVAVCRRCGCTQERACPDGCGWATGAEQLAVGLEPTEGDLCTACLHDLVRDRDRPRSGWRRLVALAMPGRDRRG